MSDNSTIEWTDATWNPITGCRVLTPGCTNCYAMKLAGTRLRNHRSRAGLTIETKAGPVWNGKVRFNEEWLMQPLGWRKPRMIFVCAHGDLFHEDVPDEWIDKVFAVMALTPQHTYQVLTKRAKRMREYMTTRWAGHHGCRRAEMHASLLAREMSRDKHFWAEWPLPNVWAGVSTERQQEANERIPDLLRTPAAVRFISAEPLLGPIDLEDIVTKGDGYEDHRSALECDVAVEDDEEFGGATVSWVIVGGESGDGARPMHPDWVRSLRDQCDRAGVPFFFKQWGAWIPFYDRDRDDPDWRNVPQVDNQMGLGATRFHNLAGGIGFHGERLVAMRNVGKKAAGRVLDRSEYSEMPRVA
ncbi:DUF5131 family protein [Bradyrhizobium sp. sGM-13]|uniref:DUF5131 family protein n=1 Tax=Bradyrhizobium sp. sGM-13 TaxID=2831781 RepID=UPI001BCAF645|nr:phage Gp37/Gp68 family protein [Bradyrhizobium sp. sGM-13]